MSIDPTEGGDVVQILLRNTARVQAAVPSNARPEEDLFKALSEVVKESCDPSTATIDADKGDLHFHDTVNHRASTNPLSKDSIANDTVRVYLIRTYASPVAEPVVKQCLTYWRSFSDSEHELIKRWLIHFIGNRKEEICEPFRRLHIAEALSSIYDYILKEASHLRTGEHRILLRPYSYLSNCERLNMLDICPQFEGASKPSAPVPWVCADGHIALIIALFVRLFSRSQSNCQASAAYFTSPYPLHGAIALLCDLFLTIEHYEAGSTKAFGS